MNQTLTDQPRQITVASEDPDVLKIIELYTAGMDAWIQIGQIIVRRVDADPNFIKIFSEACPDIPSEVWMRFEDIGRRKIYPNLIITNGPAVNRLIQLPYAVQEKFCSEPVELLVAKGDSFETTKLSLQELDYDQARQVFSKDGYRPLAEQRVYLENRRTIKAPGTWEPAHQIVGNKLIVNRKAEFTQKELIQILSKLS